VKPYARINPIIFLTLLFLFPFLIGAQENRSPHFQRDTLITAAKELMSAARYCALITLDETGHPQARTMDPFLPEEDLVVWLGTNAHSRKVKEIRNNPKVALYYQAPNGAGYVVIKGYAHIIDEPQKKLKYWKKEWERFYPDKKAAYTLIKVIPARLEIIDYKHHITGDSKTWEVPALNFESGKSTK